MAQILLNFDMHPAVVVGDSGQAQKARIAEP
jgi:hypothetical protein